MDEEVLNAAARSVLADKTRQWRRLVFEEALAMQARNPDIQAIALLGPSDNVAAGERLVTLLAIGMHPRAIRECIAWCEFVETIGEAVALVAHTSSVDSERDGGGQQAAHRLAELQEENRRLRAEVRQLRGVLRAVRDVADGPWASES